MSDLPDLPVFDGKPAEVLIVGFGAVGIIYGHLLEKYKHARVTAIARSTFNTINDKGITIRSAKWGTIEGWRPSRVARSIEDVLDIAFDYVVVTTKAIPEVKTTPQILEPLLSTRYQHPQPTYILLQNGINVEKDLHAELKKHCDQPLIISCALYIMTNITANGDVMHGAFEEIRAGMYKAEGSEVVADTKAEKETLQRWIEILNSSNSQASLAPSVAAAKWTKNIWNASFGMVCTLLRLTPEEWGKDEAASARALAMVRQVMDECMEVARAMCYDESLIPSNTPDAIIVRSMQLLKGSDFVFSALLDVRLGKPFELEVILGEVVRLARKFSVSIPLVEFIYTALVVVQADLLYNTLGQK